MKDLTVGQAIEIEKAIAETEPHSVLEIIATAYEMGYNAAVKEIKGTGQED